MYATGTCVCLYLCLREPVWQELSTTVLQNNSGKSVEAGQVHQATHCRGNEEGAVIAQDDEVLISKWVWHIYMSPKCFLSIWADQLSC